MGRFYKYKEYNNYLAIVVGLSMLCRYTTLHAEETFNPAFISSDMANVADLKRFASGDAQPAGTYRVDIYLNNQYLSTQSLTFTHADKNNLTSDSDDTGLVPCITSKYLKGLNINTQVIPELKDISPTECIFLPKIIPEASVRFDFDQQRLYFTIPQASLINVARGYVPPSEWDEGIPALLLDYNFTGNTTTNRYSGNSNSFYFRLNSGINLGPWRLRNSGAFSHNQSQNSTTNEWNNISTYLQRGINPLKSTLTIGDSYTSGDIFDSIGFRGVQLASNDDMVPESQRGFAPTVHGIAHTNAKITIRQNGFIVYQTYVAPGAFVIKDLYQTSSSGDLYVSIEENDGSVTQFIVPYSAVPILQREGRLKYSLTAGEYRSGSPEKDKPKFTQATAIWGASHGITLYGGSQLSDNYQSFLIGGGLNLGRFGAISADVTHANSTLVDDSRHSGQSVRFLYAKSLISLGTNVQLIGYRYSTKGFYTFDETAYNSISGVWWDDSDTNSTPVILDSHNLAYSKKGRIQATLSQRIGKLGSIYLSGSQQTYWNTNKKADSVQFGYTWANQFASYNLGYSLSKNPWVGNETDRTFTFSMSIPLDRVLKTRSYATPFRSQGNSAYATYALTNDNSGKTSHQLGLSGTLLKDNNLNYSILRGFNTEDSANDNSSVNLTWQAGAGRVNAGFNYQEDSRQLTYGASGGMILHQDGLTFSQSLGNTNVLIKAPKATGVTVDNTTGVKTDYRGYAVLPYASPYRRNRVALLTTTLKDNIELDDTVQSVIPTQGAVVVANYGVRLGVRVLFTLLRADGKPIPFGSNVTLIGDNGGQSTTVADQGQAYLSGLPLKGSLKVAWGNTPDDQCQLDYELPPESEKLPISHAQLKCN